MNYSNGAYQGGSSCSYSASTSDSYTAHTGSQAYSPNLSYNDGRAKYAHSESVQQPKTAEQFFAHESPESFLEQNAPPLAVVQEASIITPLIEQTFQELTDEQLPKNINIKIVDELTLRTIHASIGGKWSTGIQGFSLNKHSTGVSEIYAKQAPLDNVMLTIGHELGHVMSPTLSNPAEEEAKAFAFSIAWVSTIRANNIGNIAGSFRESPAQNGIHDTGFAWATKLIKQGKTAAQAFMSIVCRSVRMNEDAETITII
ncbi:MAG: hypothetical protein Q7K43_00610 [Candidatus Woesearchaeota archaeon]|nr:hypothetical protein [Candidatus Woesearchaeota archaeon]